MIKFKYQNLMPVLLTTLDQRAPIKLCKSIGVYFCPARQPHDDSLIAYAENFDPRREAYDILCHHANFIFGNEDYTAVFKPTDDVFQEVLNLECDLAVDIINGRLELWPTANEKMSIH